MPNFLPRIIPNTTFPLQFFESFLLFLSIYLSVPPSWALALSLSLYISIIFSPVDILIQRSMWLIETKSLELEYFVGDNIPDYAILSHTWGDGEVTFQDWQDFRKASKKTGFAKIKSACAQARADGLDYIWVDANCIDKSSSAELSEAINSMFAWYRDSYVCYVYLADVEDPDDVSVTRLKSSIGMIISTGEIPSKISESLDLQIHFVIVGGLPVVGHCRNCLRQRPYVFLPKIGSRYPWNLDNIPTTTSTLGIPKGSKNLYYDYCQTSLAYDLVPLVLLRMLCLAQMEKDVVDGWSRDNS
jgi:hypothetical protein